MTKRSYVSWHPTATSYSSAASPRPGDVLGDVVNAGNPTAALTTPRKAATATVAQIRTFIATPSSHADGRANPARPALGAPLLVGPFLGLREGTKAPGHLGVRCAALAACA